MSSQVVNYADILGIHSVAAPIVFAILYLPFAVWFVLQCIRHFTQVYITLAVFCQIRVVAYIIRTILAASDTAGQNQSLVITDQILMGVGFLGLLLSAYILVLDRILLLDLPEPTGINAITRNRRLYRLILTGAVVMSIIGVTDSFDSDASKRSTGKTLKIAGTVIFLVLTAVQAYQTFVMVKSESEVSNKPTSYSFGAKHGHLILSVIALLLLIREVFSTATVGGSSKATDERFWYPFSATTELLAVMMYAIPGLVPARSELPK